jgi:hypothetical protein
MRLEVRSQNLKAAQEWRGFIQRSLRFVLGRFARRIGRVTVYLEEVDVPNRSAMQRCRIVVRLLRSSPISIEDTDQDLGAVVHQILHRAGQSVRRELERQHERAGRLAAETDHSRRRR